MTAKIERLTAAQTAKFKEYIKTWIEHGLSIAPIDEDRCKSAVKLAYECAGLKAPEMFVFCDGPFSAAIVAVLLKDKKFLASVRASVWESVSASVWESVSASVGASVWKSVWGSVRASVDSVSDSVSASVWASVIDSVSDSVSDSVRASVWESVSASVWESVSASVGASVWESVSASVRASVWESVRDMLYGAHEAGWISFYSFMREVLGLVQQTEKLRGLIETTKEFGWWAPYKDVVIIQRRAVLLNRDERGRLHSETEAAIKYADGWGVYAVHGVRVPEWLIEQPNALTAAMIDAERNAEVRRIMISRYGRQRYLLDGGAKIVHQDNDAVGKPRTLYRKDRAGDEPLVMVAVVNSTPEPDGTFKDYFLQVPPTMRTAGEAVAWTAYETEQTYQPEAES